MRALLYRWLEPQAWPRAGLSPLNQFLIAAILVSVALAVLETEPEIVAYYEKGFRAFDMAFAVLFSLEYGARVWAAGEDTRYKGVRGRLRYILKPAAVIDLIALLPTLVTFGFYDAFLLRLFRLLRIIRIARLGAMSLAIQALGDALRARRYELVLSVMLAGLAILLSSTALYIIEGHAQPEVFGSIPRAMWWSVITLTTVGYGDAFPITLLGRLFGAVTALAGVGLVAMPAGILAAAFSEAFHKRGGGRD